MGLKSAIAKSFLSRTSEHASLPGIIANAGWLFADRLLGLVAGFLVGAWVARYLGPTQYGLLSYAMAFEALFVPISELGLVKVVVRDLVRSPGEKNEILGTAFTLQFGSSLLTFVLIVTGAYIVYPDDTLLRELIVIVAGQLVFRALSNTVDAWFQSRIQAKYTVWSKNIALALVTLARVALILIQAPLVAFAWLLLVQVVLFTLGAVACFHVSGERVSAWQGSLLRARKLLGDSWPLVVSGLSIVIYMRIGQLILGDIMGAEALGAYSVAVQLSQLWYFIPTAVAVSVFPTIVRSRERQTETTYKRRLQTFFDVMVGMAYLIAVPCAVFASPLVMFLFGPEYAEAGPVLSIHIWAFVFVSLGVARSQWLVTENMTKFSMFATIMGAVVSIVLNYALIPKYAGLGAAWAALISYAVSAYASGLLSARTRSAFVQLSLALLVPLRLRSLWRALREIS